jgi:hypothetical protein
VSWYRLLAATLLVMAILLFRGGHGDSMEIQDARGEVGTSIVDDSAPIPSPVAPDLARREATRLVIESPRSVSGHLFVSEIFRPPIAPLSPASMFDPKTRERSRSCPVRLCRRSAIPFALVGYQPIHSS